MSAPSPRFDERAATEELQALSTEYGAAADDRDGERFAGLFVPDGELVVPNLPDDLRPVIVRSGHDFLRQVPDRLRIYARTFHQVTNHRYAFDGAGGTATGTVLCVAHHASAGGTGSGTGSSTGSSGTDTVWFIRYHDTYRLTGSGWRFARRELHLQWVEERAIASPGILPPEETPPG